MALYSKICIICSKSFLTQRISTAYCSKKCANRSRSIPDKLLESLMKRAKKFTVNTLVTKGVEYPEHEGSTDTNPAGNDIGLLVASAKAIASQRGIRTDFSIEDALLKNNTVLRDNLKYISPKDSIEDADGFGQRPDSLQASVAEQQNSDDNKEQSQQKKGIRKLTH